MRPHRVAALSFVAATILVMACSKERKTQSEMPSSTPPGAAEHWPSPMPDYLNRLAASGDLYVRNDDRIISAPPFDLAVLRSYPGGPVRGPIMEGRRVTILTAKTTVAVNEVVRVIHIVEVERAGDELFVMGPKPVVGEHVDGMRVGDPIPEWGPFTMGVYDGAVLKSPGVDTNYEITTHTFKDKGTHTIQWRAAPFASNILRIEVR